MNLLKVIPPHILKRFTRRAKDALNECERIASSYAEKDKNGEIYIDSIHLFYALSKQEGTMAHNLIISHKINEKELVRAIETVNRAAGLGGKMSPENYKILSSLPCRMWVSDALTRSLKKAATLASSEHHALLGTEHLLWGVLEETRPDSLETQKLEDLKRHLRELLKSHYGFPDVSAFLTHKTNQPPVSFSSQKIGNPPHTHAPRPHKNFPHHFPTKIKSSAPHKKKTAEHIAYFCRNLNDAAEKGLLSPLIGREKEIRRVIRILSRKTKNSPLLIGEPGVGKTAIVEGLAQRIVAGDVPAYLLRKKIYSLDLGLLVAGTVFRGEFEARIKELLEEIKESRDILFIDEFHNVIGTGSVQGTLDVANILKPPLSRGELHCIGATTREEFTKYVEKDHALERRLQPVSIPEPTPKETVRILSGLKRHYEEHYAIRIPKKTVFATVELASRYFPDRFLPDKAIDLLDEAASDLVGTAVASSDAKKLQQIEQEYRGVQEKKEKAVEKEQYDYALLLKREEQELGKRLENAFLLTHKPSSPGPVSELTADRVRSVVSELTGIPLRTISSDRATELFTGLEKNISQKIVGQNEAIKKVSSILKRGHAGLGDPKRPLGSFLFLGPTGVGKTEFAKVLARVLADEKNEHEILIKLDMAEFTEPHSISKIIGAPPGYIGYDEGSRVLDRVRRNPFSVVLLDEIEKAHPNVYNILLEILEDGEITSADGVRISFTHAVIIMTSNIGTEEFTREAAIGFRGSRAGALNTKATYREIEERTRRELKKIMRPELLSRIDSVLVFKPLGEDAIERVVKLHLKNLQKRLKDHRVVVSSDALKYLARKAFNPEEGGRLARKAVEEYVENPLADALLSDSLEKGKIFVEVENEKIVFKTVAGSN